MTYDIEFNYGVLDEQTDGDGSIQGGDFQSYTWTVTEYDDNTFTNPIGTPESQAGKMVYLGITSPDIDYSRFKFIVESCQFQNADVVQEVTLFDWTSATNTCDNPFV